MPRRIPDERAVTTSINILPSLLNKLAAIAPELKFASRNGLITHILTEWVEDFEKKHKKSKAV